MARHDVTVDLKQVISEAPFQDQYLIFDIQADCPTDIDYTLQQLACYKFQQYAGDRYVLVLKRDQVSTVVMRRRFSFRKLKVYPAEKIGDYYRYFGVTGFHDKEETTFDDSRGDLHMVEFTVRDKSTSAAEFKRMMTRLAQQYKGVINTHQQVTFHLTAHFPVKFYIFIEIEAHKLDRAYIEGSDVFGGPGNTEVVATPVLLFR